MTPAEIKALADLVTDRIGQDFDEECHLTGDEARSIATALRSFMDGGWRPIETAPKRGLVDIWVSGPGSRRIADCRWGKPSHANWGDRYGCDKDLPPQWITASGCALDRRNGEPTHWMPLPTPPAVEGEAGADPR